MKRILIPALPIRLSITILPTLAAAAGHPVSVDPTPRSDGKVSAGARQQADQALLLQAFRSLDQELTAALAEYQAGLENAKSRGLPQEEWPKVPTAGFFPRFEELALQGQPDSLRWCLGTVNMLGLPPAATNARKLAFYQGIVRSCPNAPWIRDIVSSLRNDGMPAGIGIDSAASLLDELARKCSVAGVPTAALFTKARLCLKSPDPEHKALAEETLEELISKHPQSDEGRRASGLLFQVRHLGIGQVAPDFTTQDVDGVEFKLSDYRGRVVVLDFWTLSRLECIERIPQHQALVARLAGEPFALIGIDTDGDREGFKKACERRGVTWRNSWQGGRTGPLALAWGVIDFPTVFVLDAQGVIRYRDIGGGELSKAVDTLLAEIRAPSSEKGGQPAPAKQERGGSGG